MARNAYIGIPKEYILLEYIESTGTQYIDTVFKPNQDTRVVMDADITNSKTLSFPAIFSTDSSGSNKNRFVLMLYNEQSGFHDHYNGQTINSSNLNMYGRHVFEKNKNTTYLDGAVVSEFTYSAFQSDITLTLFSTIDGGVRQYYSKVKMYSCQVYDNGVLVRDFVPCKHADGTVGLYDKVNNTFYANAGTGTFTAGNVAGTYTTEPVATEIKKIYFGLDGVAKKVKKAYIGVNGLARLFFSGGLAVTYTGTYTDEVVTMGDGKQYRLLTLTSSGTLEMSEEVAADVWVCGGGANSATYNSMPINGGAGGSFNQKAMTIKNATIVIGAGNGGATSVNNGSTTFANTSSGSTAGGGGGKHASSGGSGAGAGGAKAGGDTRPFKDSYFTQYPCAGGGGGSYAYEGSGSGTDNQGGEGGSSLRAGNAGTKYTRAASAGGVTGGGAGGDGGGENRPQNGGNGWYYGAGAGGAGWTSYAGWVGSAGAGYQGACFIRIPL